MSFNLCINRQEDFVSPIYHRRKLVNELKFPKAEVLFACRVSDSKVFFTVTTPSSSPLTGEGPVIYHVL